MQKQQVDKRSAFTLTMTKTDITKKLEKMCQVLNLKDKSFHSLEAENIAKKSSNSS